MTGVWSMVMAAGLAAILSGMLWAASPWWWPPVTTAIASHRGPTVLIVTGAVVVLATLVWRRRTHTGPLRSAPLGLGWNAARTAWSKRDWTQRATIAIAAISAFAAVYALVFTNESVKATRDQLRISEQGQITDRFSKAIEQLGSDKLHVRLGGIYALERIMTDSPPEKPYQPTIIEVLSAFIRDPPPMRSSPGPRLSSGARTPSRPLLRMDVQASLTILGRRNPDRDRNTFIDLAGADLAGADLFFANLTDANLASANLASANLTGADLTGADLTDAKLTHADLSVADLTDANLTGANLTGAGLTYADLTDAYLANADLDGADLANAALTNAYLSHADLARADLTEANLTDTTLSHANLAGANLASAILNGAWLPGANLGRARNVTSDQMHCVQVDDQTTLPEGVGDRRPTRRSAILIVGTRARFWSCPLEDPSTNSPRPGTRRRVTSTDRVSFGVSADPSHCRGLSVRSGA